MPETFSYEDAFAPPAPAGPQSFSYEEAMASADAGGRTLTIRPAAKSGSWGDTLADVAQSAATGIEKGAIGAATLPVTLGDAGQRGVSWIMDKALGRKPSTQTLSDLVTQQSGVPVPASLHDFAQNPGSYIGNQAVTHGLESVAGPMYQPQSMPGHYAETVGEFVGGGGRSAIRSLGGFVKNALVPGVASEAAGDATKDTWAEPWARAIAPIVAGGAAHFAGGPGAPGAVLRDAAGSLDQPTLDAAQQLMDAAARQGTPLSLAEALQQVTNSGTRLGSLQRVVEQSRGGAEPMARFYANRPGQVQRAGNAAIDQVGTLPAVPVDGSIGPVRPNAESVGPLVQDAAQGAVDASPPGQSAAAALQSAGPRVTPEQAGQVIQPSLRGVYDQRFGVRSAQARQDYAAAADDTVPADQVQAIIDDLGQQIAADKTGLLAGPLGDLRSRLIDRTAKPVSTGMDLDPISGPATGGPRPFAPTEDYDPPSAATRPTISRPQTLQDFVKSAGGVQDPRGDLKSIGLGDVPGLIAKAGKGLGPDAVRQIAAEQGYLGPHIDDAMANTTINDLFDALGDHPRYSVRDAAAVDAWHAYDTTRADADALGRPQTRSARPPQAPLSTDIDPEAPVEQQRPPITDIENLNRTRKTFRDRIDLPAVAPKAIDKETAARIGPVLGDLDRVMTEGSSAYRQANENFARNSIPLEPFENNAAMAAAIERDAYDKRFMTPAEQVPGLIDQGGPSTARTFNGVAPAPARAIYENHLSTQLLDKATGPDGSISADRLARVVRDNDDTLQQFPAVRARVQQVADTQRALEPLRNTMVGRLAATREFREQAGLILDTNPVPGSEREIGDAVRQIAARNPQAAQALVSQRIRQAFNEATQNNMGGANQWGGAKFASVIAGNDQQARNLRAAVEALHGPKMWDNFRQFLDIMEATGKRQAPGSMTEPNRQISKELQKGGSAGELLSTMASPSDWVGKARTIYDGWRYGRNTEVLADMLTRPDAAKALAAIARQPKGSSGAQGAAALYLLGSSANQSRKSVAK